jgi:hypothetical protein
MSCQAAAINATSVKATNTKNRTLADVRLTPATLVYPSRAARAAKAKHVSASSSIHYDPQEI